MSTIPKIITADEQLRLMRGGPKAENLCLRYRGLEVRCRILPAMEKAQAISNAMASTKVPAGHNAELFESIATMKAVLRATTTVDGVCQLAGDLLEQLSDRELMALFSEYNRLETAVETSFEELSPEQLAELISALKKKEMDMSDFSTSQLAAAGRFYLARDSRAASAPGSSS